MTANTPRSRKSKGKSFQNTIREMILKAFPQLEPDDVKSTTMGEAGRDIQLSPLAQIVFPYSVKAKRQEKLNIWAALEQAQKNSKGLTPLLVFKRNHSKTYVALEIEDFMKLIQLQVSVSGCKLDEALDILNS